ncbi:MAG: 5-methylcytosine-specific restriction enzyme subunit McrC [Chryseobacterium sp.]|jgi:5-methylcytosine-specific restriction enzyme subunit McrC|nr:5-methylcytosine-specific restriction enzyme subunit McrC [Chryseobacterium sp.]
MSSLNNSIKVFEYDSLQYGKEYAGLLFKESHFNSLVKLNELHQNKYFNVGYKKITFKQFVGVIQVDNLTIEILPKIDRYESDTQGSKTKWQEVLLEMLRVTKKLKIQQVGHANVTKQSIHLLDIYFEWFLNEVQLLIHQGLIKQYYKETRNVKALRGKLEFAGHIQKNLVHKERFYTTHQVYDKDHLIHQILGQALEIIAILSKGKYIYSKCKVVQLDFPEVKAIKATENTFSKIPKSRKTAPYETALAIARLIILNYAPNISSGSEKMLALLFDMNNLWEEYILVRLKQVCQGQNVDVYGQSSKGFWNGITIRPDIVLEKDNKVALIIDTKWKNIDQAQPSTHDLRQMYVYNDYWKSTKSLLLYPSNVALEKIAKFDPFQSLPDRYEHHQCGLGRISILNAAGKLDENIGTEILKLL